MGREVNIFIKIQEVLQTLYGFSFTSISRHTVFFDYCFKLSKFNLRRVGKTTLMFQIIDELISKKNISGICNAGSKSI